MAWRNKRAWENIKLITYLQNPREKYPLMTCLPGKYIQVPVRINVGKNNSYFQNITPRKVKIQLLSLKAVKAAVEFPFFDQCTY